MHIERQLFQSVKKTLQSNEVVILLGPRQVGKSYILKWLEKEVQKNKKSSKYFDLETPQTLIKFNQSDSDLFQMLAQSGKVIFIDEFHYIKNASKLFKAIYDSKHKVKIYASGSSSIEIHKHLKESLAGRRWLIKVPPLTINEIKNKMGNKAYDYYLLYGGLPGVIKKKTKSERMKYLEELMQTYLIKDIKGLIKEENVRAFNALLYILAHSQGSLVSLHSLSREIGLTARSVQRYIDIMQHTFVLGVLSSYSKNLGNELKKSKKYYLYDIGIRNALLKDFRKITSREDIGCILESAVFLNLSACLMPNEEVRFWRTRDGMEVDFVFVRDRQPIPIEVKSYLPKLNIPKGITSFLRRYPKTSNAYVANSNIEGMIKHGNTKVHFMHWSKVLPSEIR